MTCRQAEHLSMQRHSTIPLSKSFGRRRNAGLFPAKWSNSLPFRKRVLGGSAALSISREIVEQFPLRSSTSKKTKRLVSRRKKWMERIYAVLLCLERRHSLTITAFQTSLHEGLLHLLEALNSSGSNTNARQESKQTNFLTGSDQCPLLFLPLQLLQKKTTGGFCQGREERDTDRRSFPIEEFTLLSDPSLLLPFLCYSAPCPTAALIVRSRLSLSSVTEYPIIWQVVTKEKACGLTTSDMVEGERGAYLRIFAVVFVPTLFSNTDVGTPSRPLSNSLARLLRALCLMQ